MKRGDASGESLLGHLLPEPEHPRVKFRVAATATLLVFASYVAFQAFGPAREDTDVGLGWRYYQEVLWGQGKVEGEGLAAEFGADSGEATEGMDNVEDWTEATSTASASSSRPTAFPRGTSEKVDRLLQTGELSAYRWHATLDNLTTAGETVEKRWWGSTEAAEEKTPEGRLIILGDVHGMVGSLSSLLDRISYSSSLDTLLFVGDLVSKSTTNSSLETVSLLRRHGAKGVRGNHDQGVLEWRQWMESYGPLGGQSGKDEDSAPVRTGPIAHKGKTGWSSSEESSEAEVGAQEGKQRTKRWWWDSPAATEEEAEENAAAEVEEGVDQEPEPGESIEGDMAEEKVVEGNALDDTSTDSSDDAAPSPTADGDDPTDSETIDSTPTPTNTRHRRPSRPRPTSSVASSGSDSTTSNDDSTPTASPSPPSTDLRTDSSDSLTGPGWEWLDLTEKQIKKQKLGVQIPHWDWGGEWFQIARQLPQADADYLRDLPLTLWIEELRTYIVHAGLLPWTSLSEVLEQASTSSTSSRPSLFNSTSMRTFSPPEADSELFSSPERALLVVKQNEDPFTLLNMRTLKAPRTRPGKKPKGGFQVSKGQKGLPWTTVWDKGMKECEETEGCDSVNLVYGHWAGADLTIKQHSVGLDTGCAYGRRLSALVLPISSSTTDFPSPLDTQPSTSASTFTTSTGEQVPDPFAGLAGAHVESDKRRMLKRARLADRQALEGLTDEEIKQANDGAASSEIEKPSEEDGDAEPIAKENADEVVEEEDDGFGDKQVDLGGRSGWIVSFDCSAERKRLDEPTR